MLKAQGIMPGSYSQRNGKHVKCSLIFSQEYALLSILVIIAWCKMEENIQWRMSPWVYLQRCVQRRDGNIKRRTGILFLFNFFVRSSKGLSSWLLLYGVRNHVVSPLGPNTSSTLTLTYQLLTCLILSKVSHLLILNVLPSIGQSRIDVFSTSLDCWLCFHDGLERLRILIHSKEFPF